MRSQWECLLQNLGCWQGSFTRIDPQGEILEDIPSETILELKEDHQTMRQTVRRFVNGQPQDLVLEYRHLNKSILLMEDGAFSQGSIQFAPFTEFGGELGLICSDRRLRLAVLYDKNSQLERFTLIREHLPHSQTPERPPLDLAALLGKWEGESVSINVDWVEPEVLSTVTEWQRLGDRVTMNLQMQDSPKFSKSLWQAPKFTSVAKISSQNSQILEFTQDDMTIQTLFLPDGASITCPVAIAPRQPFRISLSWLLAPDLHQRLIRSYDSQGSWTGITLVTERKVADGA